MEDLSVGSDQLAEMLELMPFEVGVKRSIGEGRFMEYLLGPDVKHNSIDFYHNSTSSSSTTTTQSTTLHEKNQVMKEEEEEDYYYSSDLEEVLMLKNQLLQPTTPNSSSISSEYSTATTTPTNHQLLITTTHHQQQQQLLKTKKQLKPKKTSEKKQRDPRFAFVTKSEVDHLEDGFRWRKYGQKAVKNSPFPRSYYRCTTATCNVKKRVERSFDDPTIVVTTYEGKHTHQSPIMTRSNPTGLRPGSGFPVATFAPSSSSSMQPPQYQPQFSMINKYLSLPLNSCGYISSTNPSTTAYDHHEQTTFCTPNSALLRDHGLLQDIIPSFINGKLDE